MISFMKRLGTLGLLTAASVALALPGCGGAGPPAPAEPAVARKALERALAAWTEGKSAESLKSDNPPIVVSDQAWNSGARLLKYQIDPKDHQAGADQIFHVVLWLRDDNAKGNTKERRETADYNVGTNPTLTVVRGF
jgi:hypothetical protein